MRIFNLAALELLDMLKSCDINLSLDGDKIVVKGHLTDDLRHRIREHKQHLVELIKDGEHRWGPGEEWEFGQGGDWPEGSRLDESEYIRWGFYDDDW